MLLCFSVFEHEPSQRLKDDTHLLDAHHTTAIVLHHQLRTYGGPRSSRQGTPCENLLRWGSVCPCTHSSRLLFHYQAFVEHYYRTFDENRQALGPLYSDQSLLTFQVRWHAVCHTARQQHLTCNI